MGRLLDGKIERTFQENLAMDIRENADDIAYLTLHFEWEAVIQVCEYLEQLTKTLRGSAFAICLQKAKEKHEHEPADKLRPIAPAPPMAVEGALSTDSAVGDLPMRPKYIEYQDDNGNSYSCRPCQNPQPNGD